MTKKEIRLELAKLKPVKVTLDGNRGMIVKESIFALAPTFERMKKLGVCSAAPTEILRCKRCGGPTL